MARTRKTEDGPQLAEVGGGWMMEEIPDAMLPGFDPEMGVNTPGFAEFVKEHALTEAQIEALVRRLEKKGTGRNE